MFLVSSNNFDKYGKVLEQSGGGPKEKRIPSLCLTLG